MIGLPGSWTMRNANPVEKSREMGENGEKPWTILVPAWNGGRDDSVAFLHKLSGFRFGGGCHSGRKRGGGRGTRSPFIRA
jgi:hypothetical protein